jgi:serine/threonine protein kinase
VSDAAPVEDFGPYRVFEQLGIGGVATVHRAEIRTPEGRKVVALKRLLPHLLMTPSIVEAFTREAKLARHMRHNNIAQTYETGKVNKVSFIAMELVPGPTLDQIMRHSQAVAGAIPIPVTLGILIQICDALDYAHNLTDAAGNVLGIIHRDVSPPNVIVSNTGVVKLVDFGIAKVQSASNPNVTGQGVIKGKMNYIAPEYLQGRIDTRADLFAVGVIAHELLTGRRLFEGADDFETTTRVLEMPIQPPSRWALHVPKDVDDIVLTALSRDPEQRWQTASALRNALAHTARSSNAIADYAKIIGWVEWAFSMKTRPSDRQLQKVIGMLDQPTTGDHVLSARQRAELDAVALAKTQVAVVDNKTTGYAGVPAYPNRPSLLDSQTHRPLQRPDLMQSGQNPHLARPALTESSGNPQLQHPGLLDSSQNRPLIVAAKPFQQKRGRKLGALTPAGGEPVTDEDGAPPEPKRRFWLYAFLVLVAGAGGVLAMSYLLDLELF